MKKTSFIQAIAFISAFGSFITGSAQTNKTQFKPSTLVETSRKLVETETSDANALEQIKSINLKMHRNFTRQFAEAREITINEKGRFTFIYFQVDGVTSRAAFDFKGRLLYAIQFLKVRDIPEHVKQIVEGEFPRYQVLHATAVHANNTKAYLVNIENKESIKVIRVVNDDFDVYKDLKK